MNMPCGPMSLLWCLARWGPAAEGSDFFVLLEADLQKHHQSFARLDPFGSPGGWCEYQQSSIHGNLKSIWFQDRLAGSQRIEGILHLHRECLLSAFAGLSCWRLNRGFFEVVESKMASCVLATIYFQIMQADESLQQLVGKLCQACNLHQSVCSIGLDASPMQGTESSKVEEKDTILSHFLWVSFWRFHLFISQGTFGCRDNWKVVEDLHTLHAVHVPVSIHLLVVWNMFYFSIYWEWHSQLTNIFQRGWNHQPVHFFFSCFDYFVITAVLIVSLSSRWSFGHL